MHPCTNCCGRRVRPRATDGRRPPSLCPRPVGIACIAALSLYCIELLMACRDRIAANERAAPVMPGTRNALRGESVCSMQKFSFVTGILNQRALRFALHNIWL